MTEGPPPTILPVFPLTGTLLLPGNFLPLNVFEARYRSMVRDVLQDQRIIGIVQPVVPMPDNWGPVEGAGERPELYAIGCAGSIEECEAQPDGRFLIVLRGVARFRIEQELEIDRMYRSFRVDYEEFVGDLKPSPESIDTGRLLVEVDRYARRLGLEFDMELLRALQGATLLNALCAALPFGPAEKQALLEARSLSRRREILLQLLEMGDGEAPRGTVYLPPTVH